MLLLSAIAVRFWEELRSRALTQAMANAVTASATVLRDGIEMSLDIKQVRCLTPMTRLGAGSDVPIDQFKKTWKTVEHGACQRNQGLPSEPA